jgi:hypothetical protein
MKRPLDLRIFQQIRQLGLPDGQYIVVGGGLLVALGLLEWDEDIDVAVSQDVFEAYQNEGWKTEEWQGKQVLKSGVYDIGVGFGDWSLEELLADALVLRGMPFISPTKLLAWKQQMNRPKDVEHIALLQKYLKSNA